MLGDIAEYPAGTGRSGLDKNRLRRLLAYTGLSALMYGMSTVEPSVRLFYLPYKKFLLPIE